MVETIQWTSDGVVMIDQTRLPLEEAYVTCRTYQEVAAAIRNMVIRGAPAIGVAAAMGVALGALQAEGPDLDGHMETVCATLAATRPTAVNLFWAIGRMRRLYEGLRGRPLAEIREALVREAVLVREEDIAICRAIGRHGAGLVPDGKTALTHCNAGALATAGYGTALGVFRAAIEAGKRIDVFADETRPFLQGARLTANGDVANKIGTYTVAVLARENKVPFYVAAPISTLDLSLPSGESIPIEQRAAGEVTRFFGRQIAPDNIAVENPAFDVTPARYVDAIITERGVARAPYELSLRELILRT